MKRYTLISPRSSRLSVTLLAIAISVVVFSVTLWVAVTSPGHAVDFNAYRIGAELLHADYGLYQTDKLLWQQIANERNLDPFTGPYRYPIHLAWFLIALRDVPTEILWMGSALLNWLAATLGAVILARALGGGVLYPVSIVLVGVSGSLAESLLLGQVSGYLFLALCGATVALKNSSLLPFASYVAGGTALKLLPIIFIPIAIAAGQRKAAVVALLGTAAIFLLPIMAFGSQHLQEYSSSFLATMSLPGMGTNDYSIKASFSRLGVDEILINTIRLIVLVLLGSVLTRCFFTTADANKVTALASLGISASLLVPTTVFFTYHLYGVIPFLFVISNLISAKKILCYSLLLSLYFLVQVAFFLPQVLTRLAPELVFEGTGPFDWLGVLPTVYALTLFAASYVYGLKK